MIKDEKQYKFTQQLLVEFQESLPALERDEARKANDFDGWELMRGSLKCQLDKLNYEIAEYDSLTSHDSNTPIVLILDDIDYLPQILIKARMAAKLSQKQLADLTGLTEEQIKRYEDNDYEDASFQEVISAIDALEIKIQKGDFLVSLDTLRRTPVTKEELLSSTHRFHSQKDRPTIGQFELKN